MVGEGGKRWGWVITGTLVPTVHLTPHAVCRKGSWDTRENPGTESGN